MSEPSSPASEKKPSFSRSGTKRALLVILALAVISAILNRLDREDSAGSETRTFSTTTTIVRSAAQTFTLSDGSKVTIHNVQPLDEWQCGPRKTGQLEVDGSRIRVQLYLSRDGELYSVNAPQAGNDRLYDNSEGRECLMNWKTQQFELLTEEEYKRLEK